MSSPPRRIRALAGLGVAFTLVLTQAPPAAAERRSSVEVVDLRVDGRRDRPLGIDNPAPLLGWRMAPARSSAGHPCPRPGSRTACPADAQTAYQIQVAASESDLRRGRLIWDSGKVNAATQSGVRYGGRALGSRQQVSWHVRVWDAGRQPSDWSEPSSWEMGLLRQDDWGAARWIDYPGRAATQPMPIFARAFDLDRRKRVASARLYLSGVGLHLPTLNGRELSDEVLAPGNSNYQLSSEYRTYDVTRELSAGANTLGVRLGNGPAYVQRNVTNPAVGRTAPYSWWQSQLKGSGTLTTDTAPGATTVTLSSATGYHVGGTINIDTGDGGDNLESRTITAIDPAGLRITFTPGLSKPHSTGATVTGSGNNIAASDPSAGAAVTPRLIARLEITYAGGSSDVIVSDRSWRTALGPLVTDAWYSGSDHDARREQPGWDRPGADLSPTAKRRDGSAMEWTSAGLAPPPNLATRLVARTAEPIKAVETFTPVSMTNPAPGTWVFDFGQNIVGRPELDLKATVPAGTVIRMSPAESLAADGTVDQASLMGGNGSRGRDLFNTYTTAGLRGGESWHPDFNYFGMQWVQVTGLPEGFTPDKSLIKGVRLQADTPVAGQVTTSSARINRIHKMARYSFASNIMSVFTDCPGREKLSYPADYTMPMGAIHRNHDLAAYLKTTMRHLVEGQSLADTPMRGNVALKTPVYDWGYSGRFGDEINWGNAIILVPAMLYELYGDTETMSRHYDRMVDFADYIQRQKAGTGENAHIVDATLADWVSADQTSGRITGTWGYYIMITKLAKMAELTGHADDATRYQALAADIKTAFNGHFYNRELRRYTADGDAGTTGATQTAQALALDAGLVPDGERQAVLDALVELVHAFHPNGEGPHFSGGTIGMAPTVRALAAGGRDDVLWELLQSDAQPSYGYFMASTPANPGGMTTIGERWNRGDSKNHMILAQIEEWFHSGLAGIGAAEGSVAYRELVIRPKPVGDLTFVKGSYTTPQGVVTSEWSRGQRTFKLTVEIPPNTTAEVWVPAKDRPAASSQRAEFLRMDDGHAVYRVPSGSYTFSATTG
ncbi:family 78 glycoside hydrolase catalytic domain [Nonomuraea sp. LP-02]|uniref:family 78 glycoside hydrolase catalytic domain n=1 Tax=Nonomuraea sp. LP-02 TaxID=3097960 RepID=UPI002E2F7B74|nr:family 78 glycoside hydrolase catalytic domain [Nonomuraea sp. LP-02]MED7931670.1 family 78 glycoside hydrolase catalytic domain [Nonomuraea sp. LP-02]